MDGDIYGGAVGTLLAPGTPYYLKGSPEKDPEPVDEISATLKERGNRYGDFETHAEYAECFNLVYASSPNWDTMNPDCKESLRIIANKIGRILNGDPEYDDNWHDIAGYAKLVLDRINKNA